MSHVLDRKSLSTCDVSQGYLAAKEHEPWKLSENVSTVATASSNHNSTAEERLVCHYLRPGTNLRVLPIEYEYGGWSEEHFHHNLRLPVECHVGKGVVCLLEAKAKECIAIALSPTPYFNIGKTYVIHIGAANNLQTVIRRRLPNEVDAVDVIVPTPQICSVDEFKPYWICLDASGKVSVGLGSVPFQNTVAILDDSLYHALRSGVDAVRFIGIGNSALTRRPNSILVRNIMISSIPTFLEKATMTMYDPMKNSSNSSSTTNQDKEDAKLWKEYQMQCEKAEARARRFGVEYKQPPPDAFLKWSEARKIRANVSKGFITGMDITSQEEKQKALKRKERFEQEDIQHGRPNENDTSMIDEDGSVSSSQENDIKSPQKQKEPLPLEQAWDNQELVGSMRMDPPPALYPSSVLENVNSETNVSLVETKIHLFSIDWAAFKQIRTDDIMSYFSIYGATYVEWLGDLSCNVHFEDKFSAARAMEALSRPLPLQLPVKMEDGDVVLDAEHGSKDNGNDGETIMRHDVEDSLITDTECISKVNLGSMGWRFCNYPIRKIRSDRYGKRGTRARCLFRIATSLDVLEERPTARPKPPPGFTTKRILGPGMDFKVWGDKRTEGRYNHRRDSRGGGKRRRRYVRGGNDEIDGVEYQYEDDYYEASDPYNGWKVARDSDDDRSMDDEIGMGGPKVDEFGRSVSALDRTLKASR